MIKTNTGFMKQGIILLLTLAMLVFSSCSQRTQISESLSFDADSALTYCHQQVQKALKTLQPYDFTMEPRNILEGEHTWNCRKATAQEWCSGFWSGILWMDYAVQVKNEKVKSEKFTSALPLDSLRKIAEGYTEAIVPIVNSPVYDHDLGFITINSFLKGYEAIGNERYRQLALQAADSLASLFNPTVGTILSWPRHVKDYGGHNTIMDNMMNLELLFWAAGEVKSEKLYDIAVKHAETTMKNHFREDGSCYHVAVYDTIDGHFIKGVTHQGYSDESMWSRGQSWAIYGYTMVYRFTKDPRFLAFAQKVTDIYLKRLHETSDDWVPLWDMDAPVCDGIKNEKGKEKNEMVNGKSSNCKYKDASAACVVASALLELCQYVSDGETKMVNRKCVNRKYYEAAIAMLRDLSTDRYQSRDKNVAFLMHSTGHHPAGSEIDASLIYADYYYLEALLRLKII